MATPRVLANVGSSWTAIEGAAASVAGVTWQNVGKDPAVLAFTTSAPVATDAYTLLQPGQMFYDKTGSAKAWAKSTGPAGSTLTAVSD
ncbi:MULTISPECIES: hypothetical protein [unclassified Novosphingobium]|uniref:hypothetical protein n=1 Tax=unclassified Novosphingobium TaxID=2644732 RepID=UPI0025DC4EA6|nr:MULTISPECIES: hypothetical protein [unclassified Novosphingobium]HQS70898.1 hypothetical protein [Novosphingobium sp.]